MIRASSDMRPGAPERSERRLQEYHAAGFFFAEVKHGRSTDSSSYCCSAIACTVLGLVPACPSDMLELCSAPPPPLVHGEEITAPARY